MVHDVVGVIFVLLRAVIVRQPRQAQPGAEVDQNRLEAAHIAVRLHHRPADAVCGGFRLTDRAVEQRNAVVPLQVRRVGQNEVRKRHHLRRIGVGVDEFRDHILPVLILVRQHVHHAARVHGGVPGHVRHVHHHDVDLVRVARMGVRDHHVHQPMGRHRMFPRIRLVDALGVAVLVEREVLWPARIAQMRAVQRAAGLRRVVGWRVRLHRFRIGRLEPETARTFD